MVPRQSIHQTTFIVKGCGRLRPSLPMAMNKSVLLRRTLLALLLPLLVAGACTCRRDPEPQPNMVTLELEHIGADGGPLTLGAKVYTDSAGARYTIRRLKYYVSNVRLTRTDGGVWAEPNSYHLITAWGAALPTSTFTISPIPVGDYTRIAFSVGVDSAANSRTDYVGDLNPTDPDMVWDWHTGYTFLLVDGYSVLGTAPAATDPAIEIKLGTPACYRPRTFNLPTAATVQTRIAPTVQLVLDVDALFGGPHLIRRGSGYYLVAGGDSTGQKLATNFVSGFRVAQVVNNIRP
jgi:hypothetical protein